MRPHLFDTVRLRRPAGTIPAGATGIVTDIRAHLLEVAFPDLPRDEDDLFATRAHNIPADDVELVERFTPADPEFQAGPDSPLWPPREHDSIRLTRQVEAFPAGTTGTLVSDHDLASGWVLIEVDPPIVEHGFLDVIDAPLDALEITRLDPHRRART